MVRGDTDDPDGRRAAEWIVEGFDGDRLVEERTLLGVSSEDVGRIFARAPGNLSSGPFPVTPAAAEAIRPYLHEPLDLGRRRYSVRLVEGGLLDNRYRHWHAANAAVLPPLLHEQLMRVTPSRDGGLEYWPCEVTLVDGSILDRVYLVEARAYFRTWGIAPEDDAGKSGVPIHEVRSLRESPTRLHPGLADKMYEAGESGMGYCVFQLVLDDGRRLDCLTGNAVDFLDWPPDVSPGMVRELIPHAGQARTSAARVGGAAYSWCLFERPPLGGSTDPGAL